MYRKDRLRRSMMFVPGNNPGMIRDARIYGADSIMFDLEDSVAYTERRTRRASWFITRSAPCTLAQRRRLSGSTTCPAAWASRIWRQWFVPASRWFACPRRTVPKM